MAIPDTIKDEIQAIDETTPTSNNPDWLFVDENGVKRISTTLLGDEILKELPLILTNDLTNGAYYNGQNWQELSSKDSLKLLLGSVITRKLVQVNKYSSRKKNEVSDYITSMSYQNTFSPFLEPTPQLVSFKNGTYDIHTNELRPNKPEDYILGGLPYELDTSGRDTPYINAMLDYMVGAEQSKFLTEYIGYMFYKSYAPFNIFVIIQGIAGNGKSTLIDTLIKPLLSVANISNLSLEQLTSSGEGAKFYPAQLLGMYANIAMDLKTMYISSPDIIKSLTGNDGVTAQKKHGQPFNFVNYATMLYGANELPIMKHDIGIFSRAVILPTIAPLVRDNPAEKAKRERLFPANEIKKELPAFAYKAMTLFNIARLEGKLSKTTNMINATNEWYYSDPLSRYLKECTEKCEHGSGISTTYIWQHYQDWLIEEGLNVSSFKKNTFIKELEQRGHPRIKSRKGSSDDGKSTYRFDGLELMKNE